MIEIYEIFGERAAAAASRFGTAATDRERVFIMEEGGEIGIGILALDRGVVVIRDVITDKPFGYFDLLARALLGIVRDFSIIKIRVKSDPYYLRFGFVEAAPPFEGFMEIQNTKIDFSSGCAGHKK